MWANLEVSGFAEWLRAHNKSRSSYRKVGFYGLDVYSLWDSLYAVLGYLRKSDPSLLPAAHRALVCFQPYGEDVQRYARAASLVPTSCEDEVVDLLTALRKKEPKYRSDGREEYFTAEQNAFVIKSAEAYYRAMVRGGPGSWNLRDRHMTDTLDRLMRHHGPDAKAIVWEHNAHIGDARYTDMAVGGMFNVGQLVRERHLRQGVYLVGFSSYKGTVIAGKDWEAPMERMRVPPARDGSWEDVLHRAAPANKLLLLSAARKSEDFLAKRGHRAIGVVYRPEYEQFGNFVPTVLPYRYDALCHIDESQALHPLHLHPAREIIPETYPFGV
jgi:erythromycin esterase-like protein